MKPLNLCLSFLRDVGGTALFFVSVIRHFVRDGIRGTHLLDQMVAVGVRSLPTTLVTGLFVGGIMAIQIHLQLRDFGAEGYLGGLTTSVTIRNVGPVLIAFILSGKVGAYTAAELGTMRMTEQIDAIRCLGTDPISYIIVPRMVAIVLSSFLLLCVGLMVSIGGGIAVADWRFGVNALNYVGNIPRLVDGWSIATGAVKSLAFGTLIGAVACYQGYFAKGGAVGVGAAVRRASVASLVCILVTDYGLSTLSTAVQELFGVGLS